MWHRGGAPKVRVREVRGTTRLCRARALGGEGDVRRRLGWFRLGLGWRCASEEERNSLAATVGGKGNNAVKREKEEKVEVVEDSREGKRRGRQVTPEIAER